MTEYQLSSRHPAWAGVCLPLFVCFLFSALWPAASFGVEPTRSVDEGYLGLALRDIKDGHTVVSWMFPGPMDGNGIGSDSLDIERPDLFVSIDGKAMNALQFDEYVKSLAPGTRVTLAYRRSNERGPSIPDAVNHEDQVRRIELVVENRGEWVGTVKRGRSIDREVEFTGESMLAPFDPDNVLGKAIAVNQLTQPLETLLGVFRKWQDDVPDYHSISRVRAPFYHPFKLVELEQMVTQPTHQVPQNPLSAVRQLIKDNLDLDEPPGMGGGFTGNSGLDEYGDVGAQLWIQLTRARARVSRSLGGVDGSTVFATKAAELLRVPRRTFYIAGPESRDHVSVINHSTSVDFDDLLLGTFDEVAALVSHSNAQLLPPEWMQVKDPPAELAGAISGKILAASNPLGGKDGWIVIGSTDDNRYDMTMISCVIDPGGNDGYYATDWCLSARLIIDIEGNDSYEGSVNQGPGAAVLGCSIIDDRAGDDHYEGQLLSGGAALYGVSLLLDRGGNDTYIGSEWSLGAACYGAGMIVDLGSGNDTYLGNFLCEGVGGPRGFGCIIDESGRDLYRANGPTPSAYGTPAVYQSFSQGVGWGFRQYAAGGVGMISDLAGDDRYEAGEFSQGGAYYYALGILHDAGGRDLYYGNRYGQGFGVHQAHGVLADDSGDDTYWSMTAASQGAAWDIGAGLLIDRSGNDSYQADGLAQGGASQQGIAVLIDLDGIDRYSAGGGATQGQSGGNEYHFNETGAFSFSLLLDLGGDEDFYSRGRTNNTTTGHGSRNENDEQRSGLHGVVIDH